MWVNMIWTMITMVTVVQSLSHVSFLWPSWTVACQAPLSCTISQTLLKCMPVEPMMRSNYLSSVASFTFCLQFWPASGFFSSGSSLQVRCPKYWSFSFSISPSNEYSGLISFRIGWFDLLAVQGTLKSLLQHHNLKASVLQNSVLFMDQLSHLCMTTGKNIALTFIGKVMSLLFKKLSRFVTAYLPRSKHLLVS